MKQRPVGFDTQPCQHCGGTGQVLNDADVGAKLRRLREDSGKSLRDVAKALGLSAAYVSDLELGRRRWTAEKADRYARAVGEK
jgi:predicted transcriptional regulator